jgi:general secretion pathway protein D
MRIGAAALAASLWLALAGPMALAQTPDRGRGGEDQVTLNFKDAEVEAVVAAFGHLLDRIFVIDPRVRGKMTLETPQPVSRVQAYRLLQSQLRSQGFAIVEGDDLTKVVPEADAKLQSGPVSAGRAPGAQGDLIVTQVFRLNHESASNLVPVLRPLISPNNTIVAYPNNNSLVVTDYAANLQRVGRIIATLDSPATSGVEVMPLQYAIASDVAVAVMRMLDDSARASAGAQVDAGQRVVVMADPRTNALLVRTASAVKMGLARSLIAQLDKPSAQPGNIHVVYLRNAEAVKLAQTLRGVLNAGSEGQGGTGGGSSWNEGGASGLAAGGTMAGAASGTQSASQALGSSTGSATNLQSSQNQTVTVQAGGAIIAADPSTNSLIITAPDPVYRNLRAVIDKLDTRRAQVFIESLIVEISAERAAELGVQWQFLNAPEGSTRLIGGTNLPTRGTGGNILDATTNLGAVGAGINLGVVRGTAEIPGIGTVLNLGLLARALETNANANILATPNLLTLDNEEARIIIGQNVPFITGQFTATGTGGASVNPFQTIERRDVGTTLRVKPQVSESGTVRLQIFQEVSSVQNTTLSAGIITNRRAIESNVLVDDGQIIVLGGLIEERVEGGEQKVPGLGDVPLVGQLFRYDDRKRVKTNLLVFLRPIIVRDGQSAYGITADRYEHMRVLRGDSSLPPHWALPDFRPSELPPMPPPPQAAGPAPRAARVAPAAAFSAGPASLAPDIEGRARSDQAPIYRSLPTTVNAPRGSNEVVVPIDGRVGPLLPGGGRNE